MTRYSPSDPSWLAIPPGPDPARPVPIVVEGGAEEWMALPESLWDLAAQTLARTGAATIAAVVGIPPPQLERRLDLFDLIAAGDDDAVAGALAGWLEGFRRNPQACTVTAQLLRVPDHGLPLESLAYSALQSGPEHAAWLASRDASAVTDAGARVEVRSHVSYTLVVLTRPARHNAFDSRMREELCDVFDALTTQPETPIGLLGDGASFCSGGDLDEFGTLRDPIHAHFVRTSRSVAARLLGLGARVAAGVHGHCIGAGVELPAFASRVIAAPDATFQLPEAGFGLLPGAGGTVSICRRIGRRRLLDLVVTGRHIDARTALDWGLVDEIVDREVLPDRICTAAEGFRTLA